MIDQTWIKTLFDAFTDYTRIMREKDKDLTAKLSYGFQCGTGADATDSSYQLLESIFRKQALERATTDFRDSLNALPKRSRRIIKLRAIDKKLFFEIAKETGLTLRGVIYRYKTALTEIGFEMSKRGYSDVVLEELFEGDRHIEAIRKKVEFYEAHPEKRPMRRKKNVTVACALSDGKEAKRPVPQAR